MPQSFVERAFPLNVDRLGSRGILWGAMSSSPSPRQGSKRQEAPGSLLSTRPANTWALAAAGWTVFGLCSFGACLLADAATGESSLPWRELLAYSLGAAWIWAALTPLVLWATRNATFSAGHRARGAFIHALTGTAFVLVSLMLQTTLAMATGIDTSGSSLLPRLENSLLAYGALGVLGQAARYFTLFQTRQFHTSELEARLAKTHLQLLRMQLQPHFLFNTLNTVAELVHTDPDTADQMITRLGRLLRLSLDHAGHQVVPLRQEIEFLRMYVEIEQVRFQDRLQIVWNVAPETVDAAVPTLLWHPVLENAIRHGVTPLAGKGRIGILSYRQGDDLVLEISDNGKGLPDGGILREGVGLRNIRERVDQLYGSRARFTLEPAGGGGTVATLRLPFVHCDAAHTPVPLLRNELEELVG
jgi:two-component system, LytTR family, sensor kinase